MIVNRQSFISHYHLVPFQKIENVNFYLVKKLTKNMINRIFFFTKWDSMTRLDWVSRYIFLYSHSSYASFTLVGGIMR